MKKPFYVTERKKKDGRQRLCIVFNNPTTGERRHWSTKLINSLSLWALSTSYVSFDKTKGTDITFEEYFYSLLRLINYTKRNLV